MRLCLRSTVREFECTGPGACAQGRRLRPERRLPVGQRPGARGAWPLRPGGQTRSTAAEAVPESLIIQVATYDIGFRVQGRRQQHMIKFHVDSGRNLAIEEIASRGVRRHQHHIRRPPVAGDPVHRHVRHRGARSGDFPWDNVRGLAEPSSAWGDEEYGGGGGTMRQVAAIEEIARGCAATSTYTRPPIGDPVHRHVRHRGPEAAVRAPAGAG